MSKLKTKFHPPNEINLVDGHKDSNMWENLFKTPEEDR